MYMPGRLRTASSPFRTRMLSESYGSPDGGPFFCGSFIVSLPGGAREQWRPPSDSHRHDDVLEVGLLGHGDERAGISVTQPAVDLVRLEIVQNVEQIADVEADIERVALVRHVELLLRLLLL